MDSPPVAKPDGRFGTVSAVGTAILSSVTVTQTETVRLWFTMIQFAFTRPGGFHEPSPAGRMDGDSVFGQ